MSSENAQLSPHENTNLGKLGPTLSRLGWTFALLGIGSSVVLGLLIGDGMKRFMYSLLLAFAYVLTFALGALFFTILQHLVKARWSVVVRRLAEGMSQSIKPLFIVALIIGGTTLAGYPDLYRWNAPEEYVAAKVAPDYVAHEKAAEKGETAPVTHEMKEELEKQRLTLESTEHGVKSKGIWLSAPFFFIRILVYFFIWLALSRFFFKSSVAQDESGDPKLTSRMQYWSAPGMIFFGLSLVFASYDFLMSLEPAWFSTMFGVYYFAGCAMSIFALLSLFAFVLRKNGRLRQTITTEHYHDCGKLMFAFLFFWAYVAFSQFMLYWYANMPEETFWFDYRWADHGWRIVAIVLMAVHFIIPFPMLMSRNSKRTLPLLMIFAVWLLIAHWIDLYWVVMPSFDWFDHSWVLHPMDILMTVGMVGVFMASTASALKKVSLVPLKDPALGASLKFENI